MYFKSSLTIVVVNTINFFLRLSRLEKRKQVFFATYNKVKFRSNRILLNCRFPLTIYFLQDIGLLSYSMTLRCMTVLAFSNNIVYVLLTTNFSHINWRVFFRIWISRRIREAASSRRTHGSTISTFTTIASISSVWWRSTFHISYWPLHSFLSS